MKFLPYLLTLVVSLGAGLIWYEQEKVISEYTTLITEGSRYKQELARQRNDYLAKLQNALVILEEKDTENQSLARALRKEQKKIEDIEEEIGDAVKTVQTLDKLSKIDEELLQKYSKVYFLNEHYIPSKITEIPDEYLTINKGLTIKSEVLPFLEELLEDAQDDGLDLRVLSAYRSFEKQAAIKYGYTVTYGTTAANTFSADQGYSEHQLGTAVDFTNPESGPALSNFKNTLEYAWLLENAYKYGFILSYPEGNSYYQYEPWHWRFVGKDLARYLKPEEKGFYDVNQRTLNEYLVSLFD